MTMNEALHGNSGLPADRQKRLDWYLERKALLIVLSQTSEVQEAIARTEERIRLLEDVPRCV